MPRYRILDQQGLNFITCTVVGWIDIFIRKKYRDILLQSLTYCRREKGLLIFAYVVMSNHIHLVLRANNETKFPLSDIIRDFKKYTAHTILEEIRNEPEMRREWIMHMFKYFAKYNTNNREFQLWEQYNYPKLLITQEMAWQKVN